MPKIPTDLKATRAFDERNRQERIATQAKREKREIEIAASDELVIRNFANELRARQGLPPLQDGEPVHAIICKRGRR